MKPRIDRTSPARMDKSRPGDSEPHLKQVRLLPCAVTGRPGPNDAHHLMRSIPDSKRGMSSTNEDRWTIPLCRDVHDQLHNDKRSDDELWLIERGVNGRDMASALWAVRNDGAEAYERISARHAQARRASKLGAYNNRRSA